ncbi:MAG: hypothetical protein HC836_45970 [Richelia sp. RM2_1_2]|nr:hypothetical protein [Richelia sp. RM2_1_2]
MEKKWFDNWFIIIIFTIASPIITSINTSNSCSNKDSFFVDYEALEDDSAIFKNVSRVKVRIRSQDVEYHTNSCHVGVRINGRWMVGNIKHSQNIKVNQIHIVEFDEDQNLIAIEKPE